MSNPSRGEASITIKGETYTGRLTTGACRALERYFDGVPMPQIMDGVGSLSITHIGAVIFFALKKNHPNVTQAMVDDWIDELGIHAFGDFTGELLTTSIINTKAEADPGNAPTPDLAPA